MQGRGVDVGSPLENIAKHLVPVLIDALGDHTDHVIRNSAMTCLLSKTFFALQVSSDARLDIISKTGWERIMSIMTGSNAGLTPGVNVRLTINDTQGKTADPRATLRLNCVVLLDQLSDSSMETIRTDGHVVVGPLGIKLIKRGILPLMFELVKDTDINIVAKAVKVLAGYHFFPSSDIKFFHLQSCFSLIHFI
jgi:hypothetical protein